MSFVRNASLTFATKVALFVISIITSIIVVRTLGAEGKGLFSMGVLSAMLVFNMANLGVGTGSGFFLGRKKIPMEDLAGNWLTLSLVIGLPVAALSVAAAPYFVPRLFPSVPVDLITIALLSIPFTILVYNIQMLCRADSNFRGYNTLELAQPLFFLLMVPAAFYLFPGIKVKGAIFVYTVSCLLAALTAIVISARRTRLRMRLSPSLIRSAMRFGLMGHLTNILGYLVLRVDMLLINYFLGPGAVGFYSISVMIAQRIWYLPDTLVIVLYPMVAHGSDSDANRYTATVARQTVLVVFLCCLCALLFARFVIVLFYTETFLASVLPLFFLLPGVFFASLARVLGSDLLARGFPHLNMWAGVTGLLTNVTCNIILIPRMGIAGAAIASSASYILHFSIILWAFLKVSNLSFSEVLIPKGEDLLRLPVAVRRLLAPAVKRGDGE